MNEGAKEAKEEENLAKVRVKTHNKCEANCVQLFIQTLEKTTFRDIKR